MQHKEHPHAHAHLISDNFGNNFNTKLPALGVWLMDAHHRSLENRIDLKVNVGFGKNLRAPEKIDFEDNISSMSL